MEDNSDLRWRSPSWRHVALPVLIGVMLLATSHAAAPAANATGDMGGFWQVTYDFTGYPGSHHYCNSTFPTGSIGTFSGIGSCTDAALGTLSMTLSGTTTTGTVNFAPPQSYVATIDGTFDDGTNTWSGTWACASGCVNSSGTFSATRIPATTSVTFPGTVIAPDGTTITSSESGAYTMTLESLSAVTPPPAGTTGALLTAYSFTPSHTFSPCTSGAPQGAPYFGSGGGGPLLEFHIPAAQVVFSALPISVFVSDGTDWSNVGAGNVSDGAGGYYVAAIVCHFSLYTAFGPAPLAPDADTDAVLDASDNCPAVANGPAQAGIPGVGNQTDTDGNNKALGRGGQDGLGDACDSDKDGDGYTDVQEAAVIPAKNDLMYCTMMRADVQTNGVVNILDLSMLASKYMQMIPPAPERLDQNGDGVVNILDLSRQAGVYMQQVAVCL